MSYTHSLFGQRERMSRYYGYHARIYDATRWMFLFGRTRIVKDLNIKPDDVVMEIGCGTGRNFDHIQDRLTGRGRLIGVDCSAPMLDQSAARVSRKGWQNVELIDCEYGTSPLRGGHVDVVLFSYSLSMIPTWQSALRCAKAELKPGGRIGVVDFCSDRHHRAAILFADWLQVNHVDANRPLENVLTSMFVPVNHRKQTGVAGLWNYLEFTGTRKS